MSGTLRFHTLDVFTDRRYGGNPLAVVLDADALNAAQMQRIAREFNLSETVFVQAANLEGAAARLRIFTPHQELPFAGHPTVGAACLLAQLGRVTPDAEGRLRLQEGVGAVPVRVRREDSGAAFAEFSVDRAPEFRDDAPPIAHIAAALGLEPQDLDHYGEGAVQASCGLPFLLVPLRAPEVLAGIEVDGGALQRLLAGGWAHGLYVYARGYEGELRARMFAPRIGEDPATGSAAAALAARLARDARETDATLRWEIHQGAEMGRPSRLWVEADKQAGNIRAIRVGGHAVAIMQGELDAP